MNSRFVVCTLALSLVTSVAAQEPAGARAPASVAVPAAAAAKDVSPASSVAAAQLKPTDAALQFDAKGVDFGPWLRVFKSKVMHNWFVPLATTNVHGRVVVTFVVHRDGAITDVALAAPSDVESFNRSARNAIEGSKPVNALPAGYPDDSVTFTVTFFYNETPATPPTQTNPPAR